MDFDWGEGRYETTAQQLESAARPAVDALGISAGQRVLDLGCGTGNAALQAARLGAVVTGVDRAARLVEVARERAAAEGLTVRFEQGDATDLRFDDGQFDGVVAVFSVIFAADPRAAAREMCRVVHESGRIVLTCWQPRGAIHDLTELPKRFAPTRPAADEPSVWEDPESIRGLFPNHTIAVHEADLPFVAASAEAWLDDIERNHPAWRALRQELSGSQWSDLRRASLELLSRGNEDPSAFRCTSPYWRLEITRRRD